MKTRFWLLATRPEGVLTMHIFHNEGAANRAAEWLQNNGWHAVAINDTAQDDAAVETMIPAEADDAIPF